jgi:hypothetical protein
MGGGRRTIYNTITDHCVRELAIQIHVNSEKIISVSSEESFRIDECVAEVLKVHCAKEIDRLARKIKDKKLHQEPYDFQAFKDDYRSYVHKHCYKRIANRLRYPIYKNVKK